MMSATPRSAPGTRASTACSSPACAPPGSSAGLPAPRARPPQRRWGRRRRRGGGRKAGSTDARDGHAAPARWCARHAGTGSNSPPAPLRRSSAATGRASAADRSPLLVRIPRTLLARARATGALYPDPRGALDGGPEESTAVGELADRLHVTGVGPCTARCGPAPGPGRSRMPLWPGHAAPMSCCARPPWRWAISRQRPASAANASCMRPSAGPSAGPRRRSASSPCLGAGCTAPEWRTVGTTPTAPPWSAPISPCAAPSTQPAWRTGSAGPGDPRGRARRRAALDSGGGSAAWPGSAAGRSRGGGRAAAADCASEGSAGLCRRRLPGAARPGPGCGPLWHRCRADGGDARPGPSRPGPSGGADPGHPEPRRGAAVGDRRPADQHCARPGSARGRHRSRRREAAGHDAHRARPPARDLPGRGRCPGRGVVPGPGSPSAHSGRRARRSPGPPPPISRCRSCASSC